MFGLLRISKVLDPWGQTQANNETTEEGLSPKAILIVKKNRIECRKGEKQHNKKKGYSEHKRK